MEYTLHGPDSPLVRGFVNLAIASPAEAHPGVVADMIEEDDEARRWYDNLDVDINVFRQDGEWSLQAWNTKEMPGNHPEIHIRGRALVWIGPVLRAEDGEVPLGVVAIVPEILCQHTDEACLSAAVFPDGNGWYCSYHRDLRRRQRDGEAVDFETETERAFGRIAAATGIPMRLFAASTTARTGTGFDLSPDVGFADRITPMFGTIDETRLVFYIGDGVWAPMHLLARTGLTVGDLARLGLVGRDLIEHLNRAMR